MCQFNCSNGTRCTLAGKGRGIIIDALWLVADGRYHPLCIVSSSLGPDETAVVWAYLQRSQS